MKAESFSRAIEITANINKVKHNLEKLERQHLSMVKVFTTNTEIRIMDNGTLIISDVSRESLIDFLELQIKKQERKIAVYQSEFDNL